MNQKGQALIEAVIITPLSILFFIFIIQVILYTTVEIGLDDALENYLLCEVQNQIDCKKRLEQNLSYLPLKVDQIVFNQKGPTYQITYSGLVLRFFKVHKKRQLVYETQI